jgi:YD repeat-containing protein
MINGVTTTNYDELCRPRRTDPLGAFAERTYESLATRPRGRRDPGSGGTTREYFDGPAHISDPRRGPSSGQDIRGAELQRAGASCGDGDSRGEAGPHRYSYDPFDRVLTITPPDLKTTTRSYGLWSETTTDARGKSVTTHRSTTSSVETTTIEGEPVTTTHEHDMLGRREKLIDTLGNAWTWEYDSLDRLLRQFDPDSGPRTFEYDDANRRRRKGTSRSRS